MKTGIVVLLVLGIFLVTVSIGGAVMSRGAYWNDDTGPWPSWMTERVTGTGDGETDRLDDRAEIWGRWDGNRRGFSRCHRVWTR